MRTMRTMRFENLPKRGAMCLPTDSPFTREFTAAFFWGKQLSRLVARSVPPFITAALAATEDAGGTIARLA